MEIKQALSDPELESCLLIRKKVFVDEQNVPLADEIDGLDPQSDHYIMKIDNCPVGTLRVRHTLVKIDTIEKLTTKIERVAILPPYRDKGLGRKFMLFVMKTILDSGTAHQIMLGAQTHVIEFYKKLGFTVCSHEYMDAGIPHRDMSFIFSSTSVPNGTKLDI